MPQKRRNKPRALKIKKKKEKETEKKKGKERTNGRASPTQNGKYE